MQSYTLINKKPPTKRGGYNLIILVVMEIFRKALRNPIVCPGIKES